MLNPILTPLAREQRRKDAVAVLAYREGETAEEHEWRLAQAECVAREE